MPSQNRISGFILAGGKSRRMGRDKGLMPFGKKPLVLHVADTLKPFVDKVTLLASPPRYRKFGLRVDADRWPDQGPLAAICTGLLSSSTKWNIFLACDLPLISGQFIQFLVERVRATRSDAVVPRIRDTWQPLSAAYHVRCRAPFLRAIEEGRRSVHGLFDEIRVDVITLDEMAVAGLGETELTNVNAPKDWKRIKVFSKGAR